MNSWRRNLVFIVISQFFTMMGFSFAMPFAPFYIQSMGVSGQDELKIWVMLFTFAPSLTLAVFSPIWGAVGDRYGRRLMLLRANFGAMFILLLMGLAANPTVLVVLRLLQGALTGTVVASQTLLSLHSPRDRIGFSLGVLSAAVCSGNTSGAFFGGMFAELFGYRVAFFAGGIILLVASLLVLFGTEEYVSRQTVAEAKQRRMSFAPKEMSSAKFILPTIMAIGFVMFFDAGWLPLLVQEINGSLNGASFITGSVAAVGGIAGFLAGPIIGRLADRVPPPVIARFSAVGAGCASILTGLAWSFPILFSTRFFMAFFAGGLDPVFQIWLGKITPEKERGFIFGWATTARSIGWIFAPLASGFVVWHAGIRSIYFVSAACFFLLVPLIWFVVRGLERKIGAVAANARS